MKTKLLRPLVRTWLVLSEVPGWPDAPVLVRLRRVAPILVALAGSLALLGWKCGWRDREIEQVRASHAYLVELDQKVAALRLEYSDQQATSLAEQAAAASTALLASPDDMTTLLRGLHDQLRELGWEATFQAYDSVTPDDDAVSGVRFSAARATLAPVDGNPAPFKTLLGVFDRFSAVPERIDLTRLGIRADEAGALQVEINLRVACRAAHEKTS